MSEGDQIHLLLIEDNEDHCELFRSYLQFSRYASATLTVCGTLKEGRMMLEGGDVDLLFLDLSLPDSDIPSTLAQVKALNELAPVIVLTSLDDQATLMSVIEQGAEDCIPKRELSDTMLERTIRFNLDRWRLKHQLQASEQRFRTLVKQLPLPVGLVNSAGEIEYINARFIEMFGYTLEEIPTVEAWLPLAYPDEKYRNWAAEQWGGVVEEARRSGGDIEPLEYQVRCKNGEDRLIEISGAMIGDSYLATFIDMTAHRQAESRVRLFSEALQQSSEAMMITDVKGVIEHVNPAFVAITGFREDEAMGKTPRIINSGNQNQLFYRNMWQRLLAGNTWQGKVVNRRKSGEFYPAMLTISPIKDEAGNITHFVGIQQNLEYFESLEAQLRQSQKMEAIGTLVGGIAHDFNNCLAGITGNLYLARRKAEPLPDVVSRLQEVEKLAFSASSTIQQLLTFSRKDVVQMRELSLPLFLNEAVKLQEISIPENITFQYLRASDPGLKIEGDVNQLQQMLMNLINNACDAVSQTLNPKIELKLERYQADDSFLGRHTELSASEYALITVKDNGSGIKADHLKHIFEPFFTTKEVGEGSGLGLAMVYGCVQAHQGVIEVTSEPGNGSTMTVYLPLIEESETCNAIGHGHSKVEDGRGEKILLVDDDLTVRETGADVLRGLGYRVDVAADGAEAVSFFRNHADQIDLVLVDVVMPTMGGYEAVQLMRETRPELKVLFATGYDKNSDVEMGDDAVIPKPYTISELSIRLRQLLDQ